MDEIILDAIILDSIVSHPINTTRININLKNGLCPHEKLKRNCVKCSPCFGGHGKLKRNCVKCSPCLGGHGKLKRNCIWCSPCSGGHGRIKYNCSKCKRYQELNVIKCERHGNPKSFCAECAPVVIVFDGKKYNSNLK